MDNTEFIKQLLSFARSPEETEDFIKYIANKMWGDYNNNRETKLQALDKASPWIWQVEIATEGVDYTLTQEVPRLQNEHQRKLKKMAIYWNDEDVTERLGLTITIAEDGASFELKGCPTLDTFRTNDETAPSTFVLRAEYGFDDSVLAPESLCLHKDCEFVVKQDVRKLWRNLPVEWESMPEPRYINDNEDKAFVKPEKGGAEVLEKCIVAASQRGRSHGHEGKPRDDNFLVKHLPESGWYVLAVADGAGSAPYSREGSRIACEVCMQFCEEALKDTVELEKAIEVYANVSQEEDRKVALKAVGDKLYNVLATAAHKAHKAILAEAEQKNIPSKQYATTLLLSICKKLNCGWAIASFWVGDGAIGLYTQKESGNAINILGTPDEGEFGGQTRFLTMPEIFSDSVSLYQRVKFAFVDDFTALFLMSDGVSDPKFETDDNLKNPSKWDELWQDLSDHGVDLTGKDENPDEALLQWLDFWSKGNHDDRTIAIVYGGAKAESTKDEAEGVSSDQDCEESVAAPQQETECQLPKVDEGADMGCITVKEKEEASTEIVETPSTTAEESTAFTKDISKETKGEEGDEASSTAQEPQNNQ